MLNKFKTTIFSISEILSILILAFGVKLDFKKCQQRLSYYIITRRLKKLRKLEALSWQTSEKIMKKYHVSSLSFHYYLFFIFNLLCSI